MGRLIVLAGSGMMLCTSRSMRAGGHAASVEAALGDRLCLVFERVQPHVQDSQVDEALALALERRVDAIVGLGGGSPIGLAKAVAWKIEEKQAGYPILFTYPTDQPLIPVVAIPTMYAGSEMTPLFGVTHNEPADLSGSTFGCGNTDCRRDLGGHIAMNARTRFCPVLIAIKIGAAVLLILGLFVLGVFPDQPAPPVQGMVGLPVLSTPVVPPPVSADGGGGFSGTLASFMALIPENLAVYLPLINQ